MALTAEESRALQYNLSRQRQAQFCKVRSLLLRGNDAARKGLLDRTQAVLREESNEQQQKVRYDERLDGIECEKGIVN